MINKRKFQVLKLLEQRAKMKKDKLAVELGHIKREIEELKDVYIINEAKIKSEYLADRGLYLSHVREFFIQKTKKKIQHTQKEIQNKEDHAKQITSRLLEYLLEMKRYEKIVNAEKEKEKAEELKEEEKIFDDFNSFYKT